uniref:Uncharacterized protein n=1 Tax=Panagrolaimus sp. PS1159 TaxID=55785 RepID=A0AC35GLF1_9BILA
MPTLLNHHNLIDIITEVIRQSHWHASFDQVLKIILSGKEPLMAFGDLLKATKSVSTVIDTPSRVDITFKDERICLSILKRHGSFGLRIIETALEYTPTLVCDRIPTWMRPAFKAATTFNLIDTPSRVDITFKDERICLSILKRHGNFGLRIIETALQYTPTLVCDRIPTWMRPAFKAATTFNRIKLLEVLTLENTNVTQIHAIAKNVKRLVDYSGRLIGAKTTGSYDFVYTRQTNLAWTKKFFSDMKFDVKVLKIEIVENEYGFLQLESGFKNDKWKKNQKLKNIEKLIVLFTLHRSNKPVIQDLVNTLLSTFPSLKSMVFEMSYNFLHSSEIEKQHHGLPKKLTKMFEAIENVEIPKQMSEIKFILEGNCTERIFTREQECPIKLRKSLESYQMITDDKRLCQWKKHFDYGEKKTARILLNLFLRRSPFAI